MDTTALVALAGIGTAFVTASGGVLVAWITNRAEAREATEDGVEAVYEQRLALKDEQIEALEHKVRNRDDMIAERDQAILGLQRQLADARRTPGGPHDHAG